MFRFLRKWLRPRLLLLVLIPAALCIVIVVGLTRPVVHNPSDAARPSTTAATTQPNTQDRRTSPPPAKSTAHTSATSRPTKRSDLAKRAQPVIRLYASFPNRAGADALLEQLRPLVGSGVIKNLQQRWNGPPASTYVEVQKIVSGGQYVYPSGKVEVDAAVYFRQRSTDGQTSVTYHWHGVAVIFQQHGSHWEITQIKDKPGNV